MNRFDEEARNWDNDLQRIAIAKSVAKNIKCNIKLTKEFEVLDLGCGTGLISYELAEYVDNILGMDNSEGMLRIFDQKAKMFGLTNVSSQFHDIKRKLPQKRYDLIISSMTLHHIKSPRNFIKKAKGILKKGGFLAISDLEKEDGTFHGINTEGVEHFGFKKKYLNSIFEENELKVSFLKDIFIIKKLINYPFFLAIGVNE